MWLTPERRPTRRCADVPTCRDPAPSERSPSLPGRATRHLLSQSQNRDDRDDHQQLDQRETAGCAIARTSQPRNRDPILHSAFYILHFPYGSTVIATRNGAAVVIADTKSTLTTSFSGCGFS